MNNDNLLYDICMPLKTYFIKKRKRTLFYLLKGYILRGGFMSKYSEICNHKNIHNITVNKVLTSSLV